jgi:hypothetical protein
MTGLAVDIIQSKLPRARVVYSRSGFNKSRPVLVPLGWLAGLPDAILFLSNV